jgi:hypothetical protein
VKDVTIETRFGYIMARQRFAMTMSSCFGVFAILLVAVGVYGVMSFLGTRDPLTSPSRIALASRRGTILSMVCRRGMELAFVGFVAGVIGSLGLTRMMNAMLFGIKATDPLTFFSVLALLLLVALLAYLFPARGDMRT